MLKLQCFVTTVQTSEKFTQICTKQTFNSSGGDSGFTALYNNFVEAIGHSCLSP